MASNGFVLEARLRREKVRGLEPEHGSDALQADDIEPNQPAFDPTDGALIAADLLGQPFPGKTRSFARLADAAADLLH